MRRAARRSRGAALGSGGVLDAHCVVADVQIHSTPSCRLQQTLLAEYFEMSGRWAMGILVDCSDQHLDPNSCLSCNLDRLERSTS